MSGYRKIFNETKYMSLLIKDHVLLQKCNKIWNKVSNSIKNYNGVVHSEKYLKTRTKSYEGKITTNFHYDETTKRGSHCICLSAIQIDSAFKMGKNYYPQVILDECKYIVQEKEKTRYAVHDLQFSFDDFDKRNSDEEDQKRLLEYSKNYSKIWKIKD